MRRAIELAQRARGNNAPNPRVGAVVVHEGRIIGEGYHQQYGGPHAEVHAVRAVAEQDQHLFQSATMYVTLEPCFHHGKTPPCVQLILRKNIPRVVIACRDPFPKVAGRSIALLRERGVEVKVGVLAEEAAWTMRRFLTTVQAQRPYVVLKWAQSKDGFMGKPDERVLISNAMSQYWTHQWRGEESAILVGTNTAALDNPRLNNRLGLGRQPVRLVFDRSLRLPETLHLLNDGAPTWIFTYKTAPTDAPDHLRYITVPESADWLPWVLEYLHQARIQSVLVEGGGQVLQQFLDRDLWDEARVWQGKVLLESGIAAPTIHASYHWQTTTVLDNDLLEYRREPSVLATD